MVFFWICSTPSTVDRERQKIGTTDCGHGRVIESENWLKTSSTFGVLRVSCYISSSDTHSFEYITVVSLPVTPVWNCAVRSKAEALKIQENVNEEKLARRICLNLRWTWMTVAESSEMGTTRDVTKSRLPTLGRTGIAMFWSCYFHSSVSPSFIVARIQSWTSLWIPQISICITLNRSTYSLTGIWKLYGSAENSPYFTARTCLLRQLTVSLLWNNLQWHGKSALILYTAATQGDVMPSPSKQQNTHSPTVALPLFQAG